MQYQKEIESGYATVQTKFNYAWGLVKSPLREHQVEGVRLLQGANYLPLLVADAMLMAKTKTSTGRSLGGEESASTTLRWATIRWATTRRHAGSMVRVVRSSLSASD